MAVSWSNHPLPLGGRAERFFTKSIVIASFFYLESIDMLLNIANTCSRFFSAKIFSNQKAGNEDLKKQKEGPKTRKCVTQLKTPNSKRTTCSLPVCKLELPGMLTSLIKQWALRSFQ